MIKIFGPSITVTITAMSSSACQSYDALAIGPLKPAAEILEILADDLESVDPSVLSRQFAPIDRLVSEDEKLTELAMACRDKAYSHPEWNLLAGRVRTVFIRKNTPDSFSECIKLAKPVLSPAYYKYCIDNAEFLDGIIDSDRDWKFGIFATETLLRGYLSRVKDSAGKSHLVETAQYLYLRLASYLWYESSPDVEVTNARIVQTYNDLSTGLISHASPTQFNAGMKRPQLASCFLIGLKDDMTSLSKSWHDSAIISMTNGGLGLVYDGIRHSEIGNHGWSRGVVPWLKIENEILSSVDQGGRRKGSGTAYITCWHIDIFEFIDLKKPTGKEEVRARDLFYGIMVSDLFMSRVESDGNWSLFCPAKTNGLELLWGLEFETEYKKYEAKAVSGVISSGYRQIRARDLWNHILTTQIEVGMPFIIYKDSVNRKSNQQNLGTIRLSNLCCEIVEYVDEKNIASCNLVSLPLSNHVLTGDDGKPYFDFEGLGQVTRRAVRNLNQVIDRNYYSDEVPEIKYSNLRNRPLGIGVQDLAGCFAMMDICWDSEAAKILNEKIARVMYYHGVDESVLIAEEVGAYDTFPNSPASRGLFQFDMWTLEKVEKDIKSRGGFLDKEELARQTAKLKPPCDEFDWESLRHRMRTHGLRNSLLFAQMPTASTAQILGNNESMECYSQLLFSRTVLSGQFVICVEHLVRDLERIGLWNTAMLRHLFANQGSIQDFPIDDLEGAVKFRMKYLKRKYMTGFEHSQKLFADLYLDRAKYQCQSSSNNLFMKAPSPQSLTAYHFHMWKGGAKTGMYYLKQTARSDPLNFALDAVEISSKRKVVESSEVDCVACGS